ncbi:hypothetical protein ACFX13_027246 [Malus domestica]
MQFQTKEEQEKESLLNSLVAKNQSFASLAMELCGEYMQKRGLFGLSAVEMDRYFGAEVTVVCGGAVGNGYGAVGFLGREEVESILLCRRAQR